MRGIKVYAPGSIGNVGCGFDTFGLAIDAVGDMVEAFPNNTGKLRIREIYGDSSLPVEAEKNLVTIGVKAMLEEIQPGRGFDFIITKGVAAGSGLGSSASSAVAGVFAINHLLGKPFSRLQLLRFASRAEQQASGQVHYDNIAPSMLGGFTLIRSVSPLEIRKVPLPSDLFLAIARPGVTVATGPARNMLGESMAMNKVVGQFGNIAGMICGLYEQDLELVGRALTDYLATPVRAPLIPLFRQARQAAMDSGAAGFAIAGSGPAVFAICKGKDTAAGVLEALKYVYRADKAAGFYLAGPDRQGARVLT